jgi:hypothetical protein
LVPSESRLIQRAPPNLGDQTDLVASDDNRLADCFWDYCTLAASSKRAERLASENTRWAWDEVQGRLDSDDPTAAVTLLVELAEAAPSDAARRDLGAGGLEDLLANRHAEVLDLVDEAAQRSQHFRQALAGVWLAENVPPEAAERLARHTSQ